MAACKVCGSNEVTRLRRYRTDSSDGEKLFEGGWLEECGKCGLVQLAPQPAAERLNAYYRADYRKLGGYGADVADPAAFPLDNRFYYNRGRAVAELVGPHFDKDRPLRILDIGAGYGHILHALGQRFPASRRFAIEYSEQCVRHLRSLGVTVESEAAETVLSREQDKWDVVVLSHVLEHLLDPKFMIDLVRSRLNPGGVLYIEVPSITPRGVRSHPDHPWNPRYDEPHTFFFSPEALASLMEHNGYRKLFCDTAGPRYSYVSALRYRLPPLKATLARMLPRPVFDLLRRQPALKAARVQNVEPVFTELGGDRIWVRSLWTPDAGTAA